MDQSTAALKSGSGGRILPWSTRTAGMLGIALLVFVGMMWAASFVPTNPPVPLIIPTTPILLIAALWLGVPGVAAGAAAHGLALFLFNSAPPLAALLTAIGLGLAASVGAMVLTRLRFDSSLRTGHSLAQFLAVGVGISAVGSAIAGTLAAVGLTAALPKALLLCWIGDAMAMLLIGPAGLLFINMAPNRRRYLNLGAWTTGSAIMAYGIYAGHLDAALARPVSYALFPLIILVAYKGGREATAGAIAAVGIVAITCTAQGKGPFALDMLRPDVLALHANLAILTLTGLILAVARQQQRDAEATTHRTLLKLSRANRLDALTTLAAGIAHEINQPLTSANAYGKAACRLLNMHQDAPQAREAVDGMIRSNERAAAIVRQFRTYLSKNPDRSESVDAIKEVREAVALLRPNIERQRVRLDLDLPEHSVRIIGNPVGIQQVIVNLAQNALDALEQAPRERTACIDISARLHADGRHLCLSVRDNGPGLPADLPDRLFEPLESERSGGSGLGLAICRSIVELHGGRISASNRQGGGAAFLVILPLEAS